MTTPEKSVEEQECECCGWDDNKYQHEPLCPLFAPQDNTKIPERSVEENDARLLQKTANEVVRLARPLMDYDCDWNTHAYFVEQVTRFLDETLQAERQKREEAVEEKIKTIFNGYGGTLGFTESELRQALTHPNRLFRRGKK